ncbi:MAG: hypothetical protein GY699_24605 [Desulfobacteraceae bacterium]|nr:hypothetical protein [Desulfobacteraceae bacterium]
MNIIGFSNYTWNSDLNNKVVSWAKSQLPETIVVFGGPNIDHSVMGYRKFFITHESADFYIPCQGGIPFVNLLNEIDKNRTNQQVIKIKM